MLTVDIIIIIFLCIRRSKKCAAQTDSGRIRIDGNSHKNSFKCTIETNFHKQNLSLGKSMLERESCRVRRNNNFDTNSICSRFFYYYNIVMTLYFNCAELGLGMVNEAMLEASALHTVLPELNALITTRLE